MDECEPLALGNIAKGFPIRLATVTRPCLGEILRSGLVGRCRLTLSNPR